ncbi:MAG: putative glycoside hydrolase/deacetylase ChbG (UPF0249 family) [Candidatus Poriferisodalaceae bacterium]
MPAESLLERLGRPADARLLILTAAGLGGSHAMNDGVFMSLRSGLASTATLMMPCPWARESAARYRGEDIGVALTLTAEFPLYTWGPVTQAPSLLGGDGGFPSTISDVWDHADLDEVRRETRAQIERAILWGFDLTHLASHLDVLTLRPEFFDVYLDLACEFRLPVRGVPEHLRDQVGFPIDQLIADEGIVSPDRTLRVPANTGQRARAIESIIDRLKPGVTELQLQPASDFPELRSLTDDWAARVDDLTHLTENSELRTLVERTGIELIGYRALRNLQRAAAP